MLDAIAYAGIFVFGIVMALLGAVVPVLSGRLGLDLGDVGTLFLVTNAGMLAASIVVGPAMDRLGMKVPIVAGASLVALGQLGVAWATSYSTLLPAVACLGFGGGILNASTNTLVADLHDEPRAKASALNLLGVFFGFGALILPFSIGVLLSRVGLGGLLLAGAGLCGATALAGLALRFPAPKQAHAWPLAEIRRFLRRPLVIALALLLFLESGNEFVLGGYFATFLTSDLSLAVARASYLLAGFWASIMVSRLLLSRLLLRLSAHTAVLAGALLAAAGSLLVGAAPTEVLAAAGILVTGLAMAGIFPTALGIAGAAFREHSGTVFGILFTVALTGGMMMPWVAGHLAASAGLRSVFFLVAASFLGIAASVAAARRLGRQASARAAAPGSETGTL